VPGPAARPFSVVAIGASAGGVEALHVVVSGLPADLPAAVLVVQHLDPHHRSVLAELLGRHAQLGVKQAQHGERIGVGVVYVAPPDMHMLVADDHVELSRSKLVHFTRPSVDLLFEAVAGAYGERAVGVVLTGTGIDGATGIKAIKRTGGSTVVQDPAGAAYPGMPRAACATGCVDRVVPLAEVAAAIIDLVAVRIPPRGAALPGADR
jgi:two-component system, chemotaxis family, protein-glutamate methylesterase/glutaminase